MKLMIAIPTMREVPVEFFSSMMGIGFTGETTIGIESNSLVYEARNKLVLKALDKGADYILWIDSDMTFDGEIISQFMQDMDDDHEFVSGIFFKRTFPTYPTVLKKLWWSGASEHGSEFYKDYPKNQLFEIAGSGLACTMMKTSLIMDVVDKYQESPFTPLSGLGEDYSLCWKITQMGKKMWCDSRIKIGHVGTVIFNEKTYLSQENKK